MEETNVATMSPGAPGKAPTSSPASDVPAIPLETSKTYRLLAMVRGETIVKTKDFVDDEVLVWPNLLVIEFIAASIFTVSLMLMSFFVNSPLEDLANPDHTPNPSKAPWYFLNLQELLLHMDPALAGVLVPGAALAALIIIPYIDRDTSDTGHWFSGARGIFIMLHSAIYTFVWLWLLILFDKFVGVKPFLISMIHPYELALVLSGWVLPAAIMVVLPVLLWVFVKWRWRATTRELILALFTGFVVTFFLLTIVGTAMRGPGMELFLPWSMPPKME